MIFLDILTKDDAKIGIATQGDYAISSYGNISVIDHLNHLKTNGSKKAICACTLGGGKQKIEAAIASHTPHYYVAKTVNLMVDKHRIDNNVDANEIMKYI